MFLLKEAGHPKKDCAKKRNDDVKKANTTVELISTSKEEKQNIPLFQIEVEQLVIKKVMIGKEIGMKKVEAMIDTGATISTFFQD